MGEVGGEFEFEFGFEVGFEFEEVRNSVTYLHSWTSLECFLHEPVLMIFSKAGMRILVSRESASGEAIP